MSATLERVMYVEDDPYIQTVARLALERMGKFTVKICSSGEEALGCVGDFAPDLVLLDVMMPGMDGLATMRSLREVPGHSHLPVILLTAEDRPDVIARYKTMGALWVIVKPFDPLTLSSTIRSIWERKPIM